MNRKKYVAIYIRVSTDEQAEQGHSLKNQLEQARKIAVNLDETNIIEYIDDGYSARKINRPALNKLIKDIKSKKIEHLIINDLDRFTRNVVDCEKLINLCIDYDVKLHGVYFDARISNADDRLIIRFKSAIAQHGSEKISENTIKGIKGGLLKGKYTFSKVPYGYKRLENGKLSVIEKEMFYVNLIFKLYKQKNISIKDIHEYILDLFDVNFSQSKISRILRNDKYTISFNYRGDEYFTSEYGMKEVVNRNDFLFIQNKLDSLNKKEIYTYFFKKKLVCKECKNDLIARPTKKKNGNVYIYYECRCKECSKFNKRINQNLLLRNFKKEILQKYNKHNFSFMEKDKMIKDIKFLSDKTIKNTIIKYFDMKEIEL